MAISSTVFKKFFNRKDILIRHFVIAFLALIFGYMSFLNAPKGISFLFLRSYISNFIYIALIWNGNILLVDYVHSIYDNSKEIYKKLISSALVALFLPILMHYAYSYWFFPLVNGFKCNLSSKENVSYLIVSVVITLLVNSIYTSIEFF
jgi:hypothetical protein